MKNTTVLIVEDETIVAADLAGKLAQLGYEVVGTAARGEEAIELACRLMPEIVLMDIRLKGTMDGIEAAGAIRRKIDLPVIYLTAHADAATLERAKLSQPFGYILKPFEERELSTTIEMALYKHQADRQLREQRERLRVTLSSIGDAVISCDTAGRVNFINPVAEALTGWSIEEARDWSIQEVFRLIDEKTAQPMEDPVAFVLREGRSSTLGNHASLVTRDGREIPVEDSAAPILDAAGVVIGVVIVFHDVTERRRAREILRESGLRLQDAHDKLQLANEELQSAYEEMQSQAEELQAQGEELQSQSEELQAQNQELSLLWKESKLTKDELAESRERHQLALTSSGMATFVWDIVEDRRIWDDNVHRLLGTNPGTFTGEAEGFFRAIHPDDRNCVRSALTRAIETSGDYETEYRAVWPDSTIRHIAARGKVHRDSAGQAVRMAGVCWDATESKQAEDELRRAKEAAEVASRAKNQFLANMSHELRTPMTGVLGMLDLALAGNLEEEQREFIETAHTSALSMVRILNDILDIIKIEKGSFSIVEKPFSIRKNLEHTINILLPVAKNKGLALHLRVDDNVPETLVGDQVRLGHVLTNLAGNAVKFTIKGKVELHVATGGSTLADRREVTFTISDTGIGIPEDKQGLIFQLFSQVDESHTRTYGGTGLGLAISKEIVERMGGTISFTSEAGRGSRFSFTIPFGQAEAERYTVFAPGNTTTPGDARRPEETTKTRLLVAEDDQTIIQVLGSMLRMAKYEVDFAENGKKVVEMWENGSFDMILMDIQMPLMNGFEATAAIREKERTRDGHIPIIAMTAHAFKEDEKRCLDAGMDAYISKPIDFMACLQLIRDNLNSE